MLTESDGAWGALGLQRTQTQDLSQLQSESLQAPFDDAAQGTDDADGEDLCSLPAEVVLGKIQEVVSSTIQGIFRGIAPAALVERNGEGAHSYIRGAVT